MRVGLMGGHGFGRAVAKNLLDNGHEIATYTGQDEKMMETLKAECPEQPEFGSGPTFFKDAEVDILVSAHMHDWIQQEWIDQCRHGCIGYHPSLLPLHRGKDAIRWTIHMKDPVAGGTVYQLEGEEADTGPIVFQDFCIVRPGWTASDLWREELFPMGIRLIRKTLEYVSENGFVPGIPQDEELATWEPAWDRPKLKETK